MTEPDDAVLRQALRKMSDALDRMAQTRAQVESTPLPSFDQPRTVTGSMMYDIASLPGASAELRAYAARVGAGECRWDEIETLSRPVPPEVEELKRDPLSIWFAPPPTLPADDEKPYTIPWQ
ncbi:hypothetical protein BJD99_08640 [Rhodococcus sp. 1163]|uniref:hypothetical protein n=1 Tax=unclassified Rhodococcus (in: high G+C Gram-positive bacteria) TaxID=192944 RepID=UPI000A00CD49|nr:hypothetical protein [Rhodococcus sp. 1163]ORI13086.1 hypothetical protein BJD99_08640 [Rhodococcus sp. 1163]